MDKRIKEIANYLIKKYPDSCLAINSQLDWFWKQKDKEIASYRIEYFHYEKLNWCGCGIKEMAMETIYEFLKQSKEPNMKRFEELYNCDRIEDNPLLLCLAYTMDSAELTTHSRTILGATISEEGEMYLDLLEFVKPWENENWDANI